MLLPYFLLGCWKIYNCCWYMLLLKNSSRIFVTSCLFRNNIIKMYRIGMTELYLWLWVLVCNNFDDRRHYFKIIEVSTYIYVYIVLMKSVERIDLFEFETCEWKLEIHRLGCIFNVLLLNFYTPVVYIYRIYWFFDRN